MRRRLHISKMPNGGVDFKSSRLVCQSVTEEQERGELQHRRMEEEAPSRRRRIYSRRETQSHRKRHVSPNREQHSTTSHLEPHNGPAAAAWIQRKDSEGQCSSRSRCVDSAPVGLPSSTSEKGRGNGSGGLTGAVEPIEWFLLLHSDSWRGGQSRTRKPTPRCRKHCHR